MYEMSKRNFTHLLNISKIMFDMCWTCSHSQVSYAWKKRTFNTGKRHLISLAPSYLSQLISPRSPTRTLRLSSESLLSVPTCNQAFGDRAFSVCAPQLWNKLPQAIKASDNVDLFKKRLKTHLFIEKFGWNFFVILWSALSDYANWI